jgi:hypothetical protein
MTNTTDNKQEAVNVSVAVDLSALRIPQEFVKGATKRISTGFRLGKPEKNQWIRVHNMWVMPELAVYTAPEEFGKFYVLNRQLLIDGDVKPSDYQVVNVRAYTTTQHVLAFWPVPILGDRPSDWASSANYAANEAMDRWVRVIANQAAGRYDALEPEDVLPEPVWPDTSLDELFQVMLRDHYIASRDHAIIAGLRGKF